MQFGQCWDTEAEKDTRKTNSCCVFLSPEAMLVFFCVATSKPRRELISAWGIGWLISGEMDKGEFTAFDKRVQKTNN